jgi:hypothetical protein
MRTRKSTKRAKSRLTRYRKQKKQRGSGSNNIRAQTLRGGRINVNNCPPQGYHIYLRSMHPAARIEVTCAELQQRINANQHEDIFIETPGPHNDEDEHETVTKYHANFFGPGAYVVGRVSRPEALEAPPEPVAPGALPPALRLHRQYAMGEQVPNVNVINHIIELINADIAGRAIPRQQIGVFMGQQIAAPQAWDGIIRWLPPGAPLEPPAGQILQGQHFLPPALPPLQQQQRQQPPGDNMNVNMNNNNNN